MCYTVQCAVHNESHEGIHYGLHTNDWPPLALQTLQKFVNWAGFFKYNPFARSATRVSIPSPRHRPQNVPATSHHIYVVRSVIKLHSYGVRCKNNSQLSTTVFIQCYGSHSLGNAISMPYKCSLHTKQGSRLPRCQETEERKEKNVKSLLKFHKLKSGRKGGGVNGVRFGAEYSAEAAGGPVLYQIRTSHSSNDLLQWRHVKDRRGDIRSIPENGRERVLMEEPPVKSIL